MRRIMMLLTGLLGPAMLFAGPVDINTADADALARALDGVGEARAQAIVEYREQNGAFRRPEELLNVAGIGVQTLEQNRGNILITPEVD